MKDLFSLFCGKILERHWLALIILFWAATTLSSDRPEKTLHNRLQAEVEKGVLSDAQALFYELSAIYSPDSLPVRYADMPIHLTRSITSLKARAKALLPVLPKAEKKMLSKFYFRPSKAQLPDSLISPSGRFKIHFTTNGVDASDVGYIEEMAVTFDAVYEFEINTLGYLPPPSDFEVDGPEYDAYVYDIPDYGATTSELPSQESRRPKGYTSWMELDNDFTHTPTGGLDGMRITVAHEFFHMIQIGYRDYSFDPLNTVFLYEMCSTWMEDVIYDDVNDYYYYLPMFFNRPDLSFIHMNGTHEYGRSIFNHMAEKKYGRNLIRRFWEEFVHDDNPISAMDNALLEYGSNFNAELVDFAIWNLFTGDRADTVNYYEEGQHYPQMTAEEIMEFDQSITFTGENLPLSFSYTRVVPRISGDYTVWPTFENPFNWTYGIAVFTAENGAGYFCGSTNGSKTLEAVHSLSDVWIVPVNTVWPESNYALKTEAFQFLIELGESPPKKDEILAVAPNPYLPDRHECVEFRFRLAQQSSRVDVTILTEHGEPVRQVGLGRRPDGLNKYKWDGLNENGSPVVSGIYLFFIEGENLLGPEKFAIIR